MSQPPRGGAHSSPTWMPSSQACAGREEVPVALAMSGPTGPLPPVIHPQPPSRHRHPAPGGCRSDFKGNSQNLEARRRPRGWWGLTSSPAGSLEGAACAVKLHARQLPCPAGNKSGRGWGEVIPQAQAWSHCPGEYFPQTLCTYGLSFLFRLGVLEPRGGSVTPVLMECQSSRG